MGHRNWIRVIKAGRIRSVLIVMERQPSFLMDRIMWKPIVDAVMDQMENRQKIMRLIAIHAVRVIATSRTTFISKIRKIVAFVTRLSTLISYYFNIRLVILFLEVLSCLFEER